MKGAKTRNSIKEIMVSAPFLSKHLTLLCCFINIKICCHNEISNTGTENECQEHLNILAVIRTLKILDTSMVQILIIREDCAAKMDLELSQGSL